MNSPYFFDTSCFIYLIEDHPEFASKVGTLIKLVAEGSRHAYTSIISVTEVLVKPIKLNNQDLVNKYHNLFTNLPNLTVTSPTYQTAISAALIKAKYDFGLPDSYQLALAQESGCQIFLTNDALLQKFADLNVVLISKL